MLDSPLGRVPYTAVQLAPGIQKQYFNRVTVGSNTLYFGYDASGAPMTVTYNNTTYFYVTNLQGDIVAILDSSGAAVVKYTYDAWGKLLTTTGSMATTLGEDNPLRYRGYVYDIETGLYYLQSRYYDPEIGRFINADGYSSTGQGLLCNNNPTTLVDSDGKIPKSCSREIIAMALFGVTVLAAVSTSTSKSKAKPIVVTKPTRDENDKYYVGRVLTEHFASRMSHHNG